MTHVDSIIEWHGMADTAALESGAAWYDEARRVSGEMAQRYDAAPETAAGVIAALSPRKQWATNLRAAESVLRAYAKGDPCPNVGTGPNRRKAWAIAQGAEPLSILGGPKVRAFYANLTGDLSAVTVDVWATRAAGETRPPVGPVYVVVADAYRAAAEHIGIAPARLQAIVWCAIRGSAV